MINVDVFPVQKVVGSVVAPNTVVGVIDSVNLITRYITRIVFDGTLTRTDTIDPTQWDYQNSTVAWQIFVGRSANDRAYLMRFGFFGNQGSEDFANPIQVQPRDFVVIQWLNVLPSSMSKCIAHVHMSLSGQQT